MAINHQSARLNLMKWKSGAIDISTPLIEGEYRIIQKGVVWHVYQSTDNVTPATLLIDECATREQALGGVVQRILDRM